MLEIARKTAFVVFHLLFR